MVYIIDEDKLGEIGINTDSIKLVSKDKSIKACEQFNLSLEELAKFDYTVPTNREFSENYIDTYFRLTKNDGFGLTAPQLIRLFEKKGDENFAPNDKVEFKYQYFERSTSEVIVGKDKNGVISKKDTPLVVTVHGGAFNYLERLRYGSVTYDILENGGLQLNQSEFDNILRGILPDNTSNPIYTDLQIKEGYNRNPLGRFSVVSRLDDFFENTSFDKDNIPMLHAFGSYDFLGLEEYLNNSSRREFCFLYEDRIITGVPNAKSMTVDSSGKKSMFIGTHPFISKDDSRFCFVTAGGNPLKSLKENSNFDFSNIKGKSNTDEREVLSSMTRYSLKDLYNARYKSGMPSELIRDAQKLEKEGWTFLTAPEATDLISRVSDTFYRFNRMGIVNSTEYVGKDNFGRYTKEGQPVRVIVHGDGLIKPEDIKKHIKPNGKYGHEFVKVDKCDFDALLRGQIGDGDIEIYSHETFSKGIKPNSRRYAIVVPFEDTDYIEGNSVDDFLTNPLAIARVGDMDALENYSKKIPSDNVSMWGASNPSCDDEPRGTYLREGGLSILSLRCESEAKDTIAIISPNGEKTKEKYVSPRDMEVC